MAGKVELNLIEFPRGVRAREAGSFLAQLDELSGRMFRDLRGASAAELSRQRAPGLNTQGMLLAHIAIVEVFWLLIATGAWEEKRLRSILGVGVDDDGMPLAAGGRPPTVLRGRTLAWYRRLHDKARAFSGKTIRAMGPADLKRIVERTSRDGTKRRLNVRWILYHVLEHQAGHYGQILLMRHLDRLPRKTKK